MLVLGLSLLAFIITILLLVSVHEFGHFAVAKALGVKVLIFSLGFGPAIVRRHAKSGTEYRIAWLPLGGYVKLLDEAEGEVTAQDKHLAFNRQSLWARTAIVIAGPAINVLFAIVAFWLMWMIGVEQVKPVVGQIMPASIAELSGIPAGSTIAAIDRKKTENWQKVSLALISRLGNTGTMLVTAVPPNAKEAQDYSLPLKDWRIDKLQPDPIKALGVVPFFPPMPPIINAIKEKSPAANSPLQVGDKWLSINGKPVTDWVDISQFLRAHPGETIQVKVQRGNSVQSFPVQIGRKWSGVKHHGYLGVEVQSPQWPADMKQMQKLSPQSAFVQAVQDTWDFAGFNFMVLGKMITGKISLFSLGGPIAIFETSGMAFAQGLSIYIGFLAIISVMLACLNILPIPGLDGGHLLFFLIESIIRRPIPIPVQALILRIGMIFLIVLIIQASINDVMRAFA